MAVIAVSCGSLSYIQKQRREIFWHIKSKKNTKEVHIMGAAVNLYYSPFGETSRKTQDTNRITSKVAYLAGVKECFFDEKKENYERSIFEEMDQDKNARVIRNLSIVRTALLRSYSKINNQIRYELKNLSSVPKYIDPKVIWELEKDGIEATKANWNVQKYLPYYNDLIKARISNCREWFPIWVKWDYIKELFLFPATSEKQIQALRSQYTTNLNDYPFRMYFNLRGSYGTILHNDYQFVTKLYELHGSTFSDTGKLRDASESKKDGLYRFIDGGKNIAIIVDCENANVFKLYSVLDTLNQDQQEKISKIILYDDVHTASTWKVLKRFTWINVEHVMVNRIKSDKSQVDMSLAVGACKQHYEENIDSFILFSSDSDYWGLINNMANCRFMVMLEYEKTSSKIVETMKENDIPYCHIDDFCSANLEPIQSLALNIEIQSILKDITVDLGSILDTAISNTQVSFTCEELEQFKKRYLSKIHLTVEDKKAYIEI